jgi:hypothetical protein
MRESLRAVLILACASISGACASPYVAVPLAVHPSATTAGPSIGTSLGGAVGTGEGSNLISVPYSEGWLRLGAGAGQLDVHMGPGVAGAGYRFDLQPMTAGLGFAVEPFGAGGYYRISEDVVEGGQDDSAYSVILAGGLRMHFLVPTAGGFFYISPVLGITHMETNDDVEIDDIIAIGTAVGINLGGRPGTSLELTVHRLSPSEDFGTDLWIFGPSVGFQL